MREGRGCADDRQDVRGDLDDSRLPDDPILCDADRRSLICNRDGNVSGVLDISALSVPRT